MRKFIGIMLVLLLSISGVAMAGTVRYLQDAQYDGNATYGDGSTSTGTIIMRDVAGDSVTITVPNITAPYTITLPAADGTSGQAMVRDANGNLYWADVATATLTNEEVQDIVGGMVTGNTETDITVTYQDADGTLDFVIDATVTRDTEWDTIGEVETIWGYDVITSTEIDSEVELEGLIGESIWTSAENIDPATVDASGDVKVDRTKKFVLDDDQGANTYIIQNADDTVSFWKDGVEYMRFE